MYKHESRIQKSSKSATGFLQRALFKNSLSVKNNIKSFSFPPFLTCYATIFCFFQSFFGVMMTFQRQSSCSICGVSVSLYFILVSFRETLLKNRFPLSKEKLLNFNCGLSLMPVRIYFSNFPKKNSSSGGYYRQMSRRGGFCF